MSNRFDSIKNKPHSLVVTSKMKVLQEFKRLQDELHALIPEAQADESTPEKTQELNSVNFGEFLVNIPQNQSGTQDPSNRRTVSLGNNRAFNKTMTTMPYQDRTERYGRAED